MKSLAARIALGAALLGMVGLVAVGAWYFQDRTAMVSTLCRAGLPNISRPAAVRPDDLACAVLGPKRQVTGVLMTSFENQTLVIGNTPPGAAGMPPGAAPWFTKVRHTGMDAALAQQMARPVPGLCGVRMAQVTVEGWQTVSVGRFGHLGGWDSEFFVGGISKVGPPPASFVKGEREAVASGGLPADLCRSLEQDVR